MKGKISKMYSPCVIEIFLILFPVVEAITSILKRNVDLFISPGVVYKTLFIIYTLVYLLFVKKKDKQYIVIFLGTILLFCVAHIAVIGINGTTISNLSKLLTMLISSTFVYYYVKDGNKIDMKAIVYCTFVYCVLVKIAELTGTQVATYRGDLTLGTKGWFYSGNELSAILAITLPITIMYAAKKTNYIGIVTLLLQIHTLLSIGTKTSLVSTSIVIVVLFVISIIWSVRYKDKYSYTLLGVSLVTAIFTLYILPNTASYKFFAMRIEENTITTPSNDDNDIENIDGEGDSITDFSSFILNGRQDFLKAQKELYSNTNTLEKLFGTKYENRLGFEYNGQIKTIEIDIYDIIITYGLFGTILMYFPILLCIFSYICRDKKKEKTYNVSIFWFATLLVALGISCIAGHVLTSSTIEIFVAYIMSELFLAQKVRE